MYGTYNNNYKQFLTLCLSVRNIFCILSNKEIVSKLMLLFYLFKVKLYASFTTQNQTKATSDLCTVCVGRPTGSYMRQAVKMGQYGFGKAHPAACTGCGDDLPRPRLSLTASRRSAPIDRSQPPDRYNKLYNLTILKVF